MPPERFGRYRVTGTLGTGAMGDVFAATDEALGREVAIKVLKSQRNPLAARILDERFRQEARAIASLTHPSVVVVFDIGLDADPPYLVMERVAGPSLKERLASGALPEPEVRVLGIQIARALAAAHERGIVHRDVKPANILAAGEQSWKLADFGVAHVPDSSITMTGQFIGSPAYAPPEALLRGQCDREGDVFGLGAVLYHAVAGVWPRLEQTTGALLAPLPPVQTTAPAVSAELATIIDRAVNIEPAQRPNAMELASALARASNAANEIPTRAASTYASSAGSSSTSPASPSARSSASAASTHAGTPATAVSIAMPAAIPPEAGRAPVRWKPFAIGGVIFVFVVILLGATRGGSSSSTSGATMARPDPAGMLTTTPDEPIEIAEPPMESGKAARDWRKVIERVERGRFGEARKKLGDWERKYGATPETESLRSQLANRADLDDGRPPRDD
ncbi:MAG: serine/threonine-protein kinase [Kofleriaceae bacterium]